MDPQLRFERSRKHKRLDIYLIGWLIEVSFCSGYCTLICSFLVREV